MTAYFPGDDGKSEAAHGMDDIDYTHHYRKWHDGSDAEFVKMSTHYSQKLRSLIPADAGTRVLEVGCGMGFGLGGLQLLGYSDVKGIDSDRGQVEEAKRRDLPVELVPVSNTYAYLSKHRESFDVVLCFDVLEHIPVSEQLNFLRALHATLVSNGKIIIQVPNANAALGNRYRYIDWTHQCSFSEHSLDFVLHNAGFCKIDVCESNPNTRPRFPLIYRSSVKEWLIRGFFRYLRRLEFAYEDVGWEEAKKIPLSTNLLATANRS